MHIFIESFIANLDIKDLIMLKALDIWAYCVDNTCEYMNPAETVTAKGFYKNWPDSYTGLLFVETALKGTIFAKVYKNGLFFSAQ